MSKVICVNNKPLYGGTWPLLKKLIEGETYHIAEVAPNGGVILKETYEEQYRLRHGFDPRRFIPISEIDETERLEAWQRERMTETDRVLQAIAESMPVEEMSEEATARMWQGIQKHMGGRI